jgi:RNase P/RNase MRP subunit p29
MNSRVCHEEAADSDTDLVLVVPKEFTIFKLEIALGTSEPDSKAPTLVLELHGSQLAKRPAERSAKSLKLHIPLDL